jgi:hypothetical protein
MRSDTLTGLGLGSIASFVDFISNLVAGITTFAMLDEGHVASLDIIHAVLGLPGQ